MHWHITHVTRLPDDGDYAIDLERGDEYATALVSVLERAQHDPELCVQSCTSRAAREWLEELEHERHVIDACESGLVSEAVRAEQRRAAAQAVDAALRAAMRRAS